jgi:hypothetical protein
MTPPQTMQQLDIFADSHDVMLRNDVLEQLQCRDAVPGPIGTGTARQRIPGRWRAACDDGAGS